MEKETKKTVTKSKKQTQKPAAKKTVKKNLESNVKKEVQVQSSSQAQAVSFKEDQKSILIIIILLLILLILGGTYAWLRITLPSNQVHVLRAGKIEVKLNENFGEHNEIHIEKAVPMSDSQGLDTPVYTFELQNTSSNVYDYVVYLDDLPLNSEEKIMDDSDLKFAISQNDGAIAIKKWTDAQKNPNREIARGTIGTENIKYKLQIWMDKNASISAMGTVFYAKLRVEVTQRH